MDVCSLRHRRLPEGALLVEDLMIAASILLIGEHAPDACVAVTVLVACVELPDPVCRGDIQQMDDSF